jgi:RNA polymerase sigma factor (sigma-70 family)
VLVAGETHVEVDADTESVDLVFEEAFDHLYQRAYVVAYQLLGVRSEAQDVAQEALARAFSRWRQISAYAEPWLVRTAGNLAIGAWRKNRRLFPLRQRHERSHPGPDGRRVDLHRALSTLSRRQRDVVVLRYLADLSEADVARMLGCSAGTVKQHASRGLATLREALRSEVH